MKVEVHAVVNGQACDTEDCAEGKISVVVVPALSQLKTEYSEEPASDEQDEHNSYTSCLNKPLDILVFGMGDFRADYSAFISGEQHAE